jgi:hypothetical protein
LYFDIYFVTVNDINNKQPNLLFMEEDSNTKVTFNLEETEPETLELKTELPEDNTFESRLKTYIQSHKPYVVLLTPCYGGVCHVNYTCCLINTINLFNDLGIKIKVEFCKNDSLVSRARNNLIARAMSDTATTHFMFIDSDITWNPVDILKCLISDKPLVGGMYPVKMYHWERLISTNGDNVVQKWIDHKNDTVLRSVDDADYIQQRLLRYNINFASAKVQIEKNLMEVKHLATGFMLIQRNVIETMMKAFPSTKYVDDVNFLVGDENNYAYALFDCGVEEGHYFSEDWLFCSRWTKLGGKVYVDVTINLTHTGPQDYRGSFVSTLL